jgi:hypothetical protein
MAEWARGRMWIELDFDEQRFPEPVWDSLYVTARALRHVGGDAIERVRIEGQRADVDGSDATTLRITVTLRVNGTGHDRTIEFGPAGRWRVRSPELGDDTPFQTFLPRTQHLYERDLINRTELQVALLHQELPRWLQALRHGVPA